MLGSTSFVVALIVASAIGANCEDAPVPIVLWHGMGDSCCFSFSLGAFKERLMEAIPGVYVLSIRIGSNVISDMENSYFLHPDKQIEEACKIVSEDENLANGFNAIGFSQGGQFLRALVQRCPSARVKNLISLGGQHQGVYGLPNCASLAHPTCDYIRKLLNHAAYLGWVQDKLVQATYWHDPLNEEEYRNASTFLADINNERVINPTYIQNLANLKNLILVKFENDSMVQPVESEWFGFYTPGQSVETQTLEESDLYLNNRLGLQRFVEEGRIQYLSTPGDHLQFEWTWFTDNIIKPFLSP